MEKTENKRKESLALLSKTVAERLQIGSFSQNAFTVFSLVLAGYTINAMLDVGIAPALVAAAGIIATLVLRDTARELKDAQAENFEALLQKSSHNFKREISALEDYIRAANAEKNAFEADLASEKKLNEELTALLAELKEKQGKQIAELISENENLSELNEKLVEINEKFDELNGNAKKRIAELSQFAEIGEKLIAAFEKQGLNLDDVSRFVAGSMDSKFATAEKTASLILTKRNNAKK